MGKSRKREPSDADGEKPNGKRRSGEFYEHEEDTGDAVEGDAVSEETATLEVATTPAPAPPAIEVAEHEVSEPESTPAPLPPASAAVIGEAVREESKPPSAPSAEVTPVAVQRRKPTPETHWFCPPHPKHPRGVVFWVERDRFEFCGKCGRRNPELEAEKPPEVRPREAGSVMPPAVRPASVHATPIPAPASTPVATGGIKVMWTCRKCGNKYPETLSECPVDKTPQPVTAPAVGEVDPRVPELEAKIRGYELRVSQLEREVRDRDDLQRQLRQAQQELEDEKRARKREADDLKYDQGREIRLRDEEIARLTRQVTELGAQVKQLTEDLRRTENARADMEGQRDRLATEAQQHVQAGGGTPPQPPTRGRGGFMSGFRRE